MTFLVAAAARAEPTPAGPGLQDEIKKAMAAAIATYGLDAANLEGNLLQQAIQGGSILEASVSITGPETHDGMRLLGFRLDSGVVFDDTSVPAASRTEHVWTAIVDPALAKCRRLDIPADGVVLRVGYLHSSYRDRTDLQRQLREGAVVAETVSFRLRSSDILDRANERITSVDLAARAQTETGEMPAPAPTIPPTPR